VHFVGLNSVDNDDLWYFGHVDSLQLAWLAKDVARLPSGTPVVTFNHIPLASSAQGLRPYTDEPPSAALIKVRGTTKFRHVVSNTDSILAALGQARLEIALGGHDHVAQSIAFPTTGGLLRFHQTGAIVAPSDVAGRLAPSGFTVYRVRGGKVDDGTFVPIP
jgi:hypothetical protein